MGTQIGEVNINLRLSLAQFSKDVKQGTDDARKGTKDMADSMKDNTGQAKAAMALLGEEIGVTIPRHLRTFIAELPGVASAMSAAFNSVAVLALIELLVKLVEKIQEWKKAAEEAAAASAALGTAGEKAFRGLDEQLLELQIKLDDVRGNHLAALQDSLKLIDMQKLDRLAAEFDNIGHKADEVFQKLTVHGFEALVGMGDNASVNEVKEHFDAIIAAVDRLKNMNASDADVFSALHAGLADINYQIDHQRGLSSEAAKALLAAQDALQMMEGVYTRVNKVAEDQGKIKTLEEQKRLLEESTKAAKELAADLQKVNDFLEKQHSNTRTTLPG